MFLYYLLVVLFVIYIVYIRRRCDTGYELSDLGKWAVVTGATDGIGKAFAFELARKGFSVALVSRSRDRLESVAKEIQEQCSVSTKIVQADFSSTDSEMYARIGKELKNLDVGVLVNNVGMSSPCPDYFLEWDKCRSYMYQDMLNCNITSTVQMTRLLLPGMAERRRGLVVNIASGFAILPAPFYSLYGGTKSFVKKFSEGLEIEYRDKGVHVHTLTTGLVATKLSGVRRTSFFVPDPDTYAKSALQLAMNHQICDGYFGHQIVSDIITMFTFIFPGFVNTIVSNQFRKRRVTIVKRQKRESS